MKYYSAIFQEMFCVIFTHDISTFHIFHIFAKVSIIAHVSQYCTFYFTAPLHQFADVTSPSPSESPSPSVTVATQWIISHGGGRGRGRTVTAHGPPWRWHVTGRACPAGLSRSVTQPVGTVGGGSRVRGTGPERGGPSGTWTWTLDAY